MWKWLAIAVGIFSLAVAIPLHQAWAYYLSPARIAAGWLLAAILAAQLTALVLRRWRLSLLGPVLALVVLFVDAQWLGPDCSKGCDLIVIEAK